MTLVSLYVLIVVVTLLQEWVNAISVTIEHDFQPAEECRVCINDNKCQAISFDQEFYISDLSKISPTSASDYYVSVTCSQQDSITNSQQQFSGTHHIQIPKEDDADDCEETCSIHKHRSSLSSLSSSLNAEAAEDLTLKLSQIISDRRILTSSVQQEKEILDIINPKL